MKVLIVKVSALGDVIHALPVLSYLKSSDAGIEIDWLVEESFAGVLEGHPLIRKVHLINTRRWRKSGVFTSIQGARQTVHQLRAEHYDVVLDLQGNSKSGLFTLFSGAPERYGFDRNVIREQVGLLATNHRVTLGDGDFHITDRSLAVAKAAFPEGTELRTAGPLSVDEVASQTVDRMLTDAGLSVEKKVVLLYGTTWVTKL